MKERLPVFALTKDEIAIARAVSDQRELSINQLAKKLDSSEGWASRVVKKLEDKGIVETKREGMRKVVAVAQANYAQSLAELVRSEPYVPWEKLLSYSNSLVLLANATGETDFEAGLSATTKWRALRNLSIHGLVPKSGGDVAPRIRRFATEYADHISQKFGREILPREAIVLWRKGFSYLFKIRKPGVELRRFKRTAISVYSEYGIQLVTNDIYYYCSPERARLSLEEVILHTLLIDPERQTYETYALLLIFKEYRRIDFEALKKRSDRYNLRRRAEDIIRYIHTRGEEREWPLPKWHELEEQARMYRIAMPSAE
ncbi:MAG: helix-turn-helix domain-containing protein [Nitrososphaerales archaeon]